MDCKVCGRPTDRIMIRRGTSLCCNICEGIDLDKLDTPERLQRALDYLWSINTHTSITKFTHLAKRLK